ncbi:YciI family protein [Rhodococcus sp. 14-2483-1-2]|uniref:YciI family protein n=1 Tax=Rhodococcus sp. 14-2483-1-2 TaxID=2023147 RepID=UPI000B9B15AA|nr:hypothetical protein CH295_25955 [Rhodococcus sp. 14-2483-1-2]
MLQLAEVTFVTSFDPDTRPGHREWITQQVTDGRILFSGVLPASDGGSPVGLLLLATGSIDAARTLLESDPMVASGQVEMRIVDFEPHVCSANLRTLLGQDVASLPTRC